MDEQDEIFTSPDLPAEISALSSWIDAERKPTLQERIRFPLLMVLIFLFEIGLVFLFGAQVLGFDGEATVERWLGAASGPWSLPVAVAAFAVLAFVGVPQFMLIAAAVVAFGAWTGFAYSWIGTMVSSLVGFYLGRIAGARTLKTFSGEGLRQFLDRCGAFGKAADDGPPGGVGKGVEGRFERCLIVLHIENYL